MTIAWAKTAPHLDSPSSTYAYLYPLHSDLFFPRPKPQLKKKQINPPPPAGIELSKAVPVVMGRWEFVNVRL